MHFINRKLLVKIVRLLLMAMLFVQYSMATQACLLNAAHPAMAFATDGMADCVMHVQAQHNPNACLIHCTADDQTLDSHQPILHLAAALPAFGLPAAPLPELIATRNKLPQLVAAPGGPPIYLLLQNFRI